MDIQITKMTLNDFNLISKKLISEFDDFWNTTTLKEELTNQNSYYLVAKLENQIIGFAGIKLILDEADLMNIVIRKNMRNQGIGTLLLNHLIIFCTEQNLLSITLEVGNENIPAICIYQNLGFDTISIRKNYYKNQDAVIMKKILK